jgi:preprotein translocase subunit SecA
MHAPKTDHEIERLEGLSCIENKWAETTDMRDKVNEKVELRFIEPLGVPQGRRS